MVRTSHPGWPWHKQWGGYWPVECLYGSAATSRVPLRVAAGVAAAGVAAAGVAAGRLTSARRFGHGNDVGRAEADRIGRLVAVSLLRGSLGFDALAVVLDLACRLARVPAEGPGH